MTMTLQLRFREREDAWPEPDVAAFRVRARVDAPLHAAPEEIAVMPGRTPIVPRAPIVVFFQPATFAIPEPMHPSFGELELDSWSVRPTLFGYLAEVSTARTSTRRSRASWVIAACLPFALVSDALAAPAVQRPKKTPSKPLSEITELVEPAPSEPAAPTEPTPSDGAPAGDPFLESPPAETTDTPADPPPAPTVKRDDQAIVDAAWEGVDGFDVELVLKGGAKMRGRVGAVQSETFTLIQAETGSVLVLPKSGVVSLRARMPKAVPTKTGTGLIAGGVVLTTIGAPLFITGVVFLGVCPSCTYIHLPMLLIGGGALGGGIPMITAGARRRRRFLEAVAERGFTAAVMPSRHGWTGGLRFRF